MNPITEEQPQSAAISATSAGEEPIASRRDRRVVLEKLAPLLALLVLVGCSAIFSRAFLKPENIFNLMRNCSFIGIVSIGMTLAIISGGIDLSVGALVAFAGVLGMWVMNIAIHAPVILKLPAQSGSVEVLLARVAVALHLAGSESAAVFLAIATMLVVTTLAGAMNGLLIAKGKLAPFIATLATMAFFRSLAQTIAEGGEIRSASGNLFEKIGAGGIPVLGAQIAPHVPLIIPYPVIIFVILAIAAHVLLNRTRYGRYVYAIGCNERSAIYSAVNVDRVKIVTYTMVGLLCGVAGLLLSSRLNSVDSSGAGMLYELDAIAAVVIGGTRMQGGSGSIWGTVAGVLILGIIGNMLTLMDVSAQPQGMVKGVIIIAAVLVQQAGRRNK